MQQGRERCGLIGKFIKNQDERVAFQVKFHIVTEKDSEGFVKNLPIEFEVGEEIPIEQIVNDHRGVVIYDDGIVREGEIAQKGSQYVLVSDYDDGLDVASLGEVVANELRVKLKPEVYDPDGAAKRLRFLKLNLGGFFEDGLK